MLLGLESFIPNYYALDHVHLEKKLDTKGDRHAFVIDTRQGQFVDKLTYPDRPETVVQREVGVLDFLHTCQFPAPVPLKTIDGGWLAPFQERFVYLYHYIDGSSPAPNLDFYTRLGATLARLHILPAGPDLVTSDNTPANLFPGIKIFLGNIENAEHQAYAQELMGYIDQFPDFKGLPCALSHTDPWFDNLVEDRERSLFLVDWDDTGISYALLDVGYVIAHLCTFTPQDQEKWDITPRARIAWKPEWALAFLTAYQNIRPLTPHEKDLLTDATLFNMIEYIQDWDNNTLIVDNYLRYQILKEQVKFLL